MTGCTTARRQSRTPPRGGLKAGRRLGRLAAAAVVAAFVTVVAACRTAPERSFAPQPEASADTAPADPGTTPTDPDRGPARPPLSDPPDPGPAPEDHGFAPAELSAAVQSSVRVSGAACRGIVREGSGFAVHDGDLIATIAHLMVGMAEPTVELADGRKLPAVPVAIDAVNDLAVLRVPDAGLAPLPLTEAVPDGTVGAVLAWEEEAAPDPTPFRIDRPVTVRTDAVVGDERIERPSWLLAADVEVGDSGAALVAAVGGRRVALGVVWSTSRRGDVAVAYATRAGALKELLDSSDLKKPAEVPECP